MIEPVIVIVTLLGLIGNGAPIFLALGARDLLGLWMARGSIVVPQMLERGYLRGLAAGSVAPSGALAMLISPSVLFIIYGAVSGVSVGPLCIGGIVVMLSSQLSGHSDKFLYNLQRIDVPVVIARDHLRNAIRKFLVLHHVLPGARLHCW